MIPFSLHKGLIILPVSINGYKELNFILDTGIRSVVLFKKKDAERIGLIPERTVVFSGVGGDNRVEGDVAHNVRITIRGVQGNGISVVTLQKGFNGSHLDNIHGALGYQIFSRFIVKIDYPNSQITLYEPAAFPAPAGFQEIPILIENTAPYVYGEVAFRGDPLPVPVKLLIDTGFNDKLILFPNNNLKTKMQRLTKTGAYQGAGLGGSLDGSLLEDADLRLGPVTIFHIHVIKPGFNEYASDEFLNNRDGIIGGGLLAGFEGIINYAGQKLYLKPVKIRDV